MANKVSLLASIGLVVAVVCLESASGHSNTDQCWFGGPRVDCGWIGVTESHCLQRGCCWSPANFDQAPHIDLPWCFQKNNAASVYAATADSSENSTSGASKASHSVTLQLRQSTLPELGPDFQALKFTTELVAPGIVRIRITQKDTQRWEVPISLFPKESIAGGGNGYYSNSETSQFVHSDDIEVIWDAEPFAFRILRHLNATATQQEQPATTQSSSSIAQTLWDSTSLRLIFKDQYLELSTWIDHNVTLYGAGERGSKSLHLIRNAMPRTLWNRDSGPSFIEQNSYGSHPFVLALDPSGQSWGCFLLNSNGNDIIPASDRLSWRVIGGVMDLFVFTGPTPADVMDQFTRVIGRPAMMPYWASGWQQSKYGYKNIWEVEQVVANYSKAKIPLEAIYTDIDYLDHWKDFTFDPVKFPLPDVQRFVENLEKKGQKWVPIVDPGIKIESGYQPYEIGLKNGAFLKSFRGANSKENYLGWVWPGATHFPDLLSPQGAAFLAERISEHHSQVSFSGIWIDMNEAANFCTGEYCKFHNYENTSTAAALNSDTPPWECNLDCSYDVRSEINSTLRAFLDPPYQISHGLQRLALNTKTLSVLASHLNGALQYNTHNLYGLSESVIVHKTMQTITNKRPFVLSRSTFSGSGAYAAHWSGDNSATWEDMSASLPGVLSSGLFGMPMAGADICGFSRDTTEELCARWVALGALAYPFSRSHSDLYSQPQEPYIWPSVAETARNTLYMRYQLLTYLYTLHRISHERGLPVARPLWLNYPEDMGTHKIDRQLMVGDALLVAPVLQQGATRVKAYFPKGTVWYSAFDDQGDVRIDTRDQAQIIEVPAPLNSIPLYIRGGKIVPMHTFEQGTATTTAEVRRSPLMFVMALQHPVGSLHGSKNPSKSQLLEGFAYFDDGESIEVGTSACNFLYFKGRVEYFPLLGQHGAELVLGFKIPSEFAIESNKSTCADFEWPGIVGVKVLGWDLPLSSAAVMILSGTEGGNEHTEILHKTDLDIDQAETRGSLQLTTSDNHVFNLNSSNGMKFVWSSSADRAAFLF